MDECFINRSGSCPGNLTLRVNENHSLSRSKMFEFSLIQKFRQCTYRASGFDPEAPYSVDDPPFCQEINQIALDNAIEALGRFS